MIEKPELKSVLLFTPSFLGKNRPFFSALHIRKKDNKTSFEEKELNDDQIGKYFHLRQEIFTDVLKSMTSDGLKKMYAEIENKFFGKKVGQAFKDAVKKNGLRKLHEAIASFRQFAVQLTTYARVEDEKNHFKNIKCSFAAERPALSFLIVKKENAFVADPVFTINGAEISSRDIRKYLFLIEYQQCFYQLSFADFETLEWLHSIESEENAMTEETFEENIIAVLEANYPVDRNNLFQKDKISCLPVNRVRMSEISKNFLVLNPEWDYDGFVVEPPFKKEEHKSLNGKAYIIERNVTAETAFTDFLKSLHPNFPKQFNGYYYLSFADAQKKQWFLNTFHRLLELNTEIIGMDMLQHFRYSPHRINTEAAILTSEGKDLQLKMNIRFGTENVSLAELQKIMHAGQRAILLKDGSMGILDEKFSADYGAIIRHGKISGQQITVPRWLAFVDDQSDEKDQVLRPVLNAGWWAKWKSWQSLEEQVFQLPKAINASLRPYQQKGFEWMALLAEAGAGGLLADDMGLGKTLQTISFLAHQSVLTPEAKFLVVCPASLMYNWQQELEKFAPSMTVLVYYGSGRQDLLGKNTDCQVVISSYGTVRSDIERLTGIYFQTIVLDESHHVKNRASLTARAISQLNATTRFALSGTPLMNNTFDLYAQFDFVLPGLFGNAEFFKREYADPIDRYQQEEKVKALRKLTDPFLLRRTKEKVAADLPEKTETVQWCNMYPAQRELYETVKSDIRGSIFLQIKEQGLNKSKLNVLQGILKLRQICNSPLLVNTESQPVSDSVKLDVLTDELLNNLKNHKVLVFSQFTGMLDLIAKRLIREQIKFFHFDGSTAAAKRMEMVEAFQQTDCDKNVFLISLKAGNTGLNLTAADYVFLVDPWWNEAVQQQAIDRTHRIGQTKKVFAYKMICRDTIEEKILSLQEKKKHLSEELITADEGFVKNLDEDDIRWLFE